MNSVGLEDELEDFVHLTFCSDLPFPRSLAWDPFRPNDGNEIFFGAIQHVIVELGIPGNLKIEAFIKMTMALL